VLLDRRLERERGRELAEVELLLEGLRAEVVERHVERRAREVGRERVVAAVLWRGGLRARGEREGLV
jgi:hypothetical protein